MKNKNCCSQLQLSVLAIVGLLLVVGSGTFAADDLKISIWTNPKTYLKEFPIGIDQAEIYNQLGVPVNTMRMGEKEIWVYQVGEGYGLRKFSFEILNGKVIDVRYNDQGPWNGKTAKELQADKKP